MTPSGPSHVIIAILIASACTKTNAASPPPAAIQDTVADQAGASSHVADTLSRSVATSDSVRGRLVFSGPTATGLIHLSTTQGQTLRVLGLPRNILQQLAGLEIVLVGTRKDGGPMGGTILEATDYSVRGVAGQYAYDGTLRRKPSGDVLELRDGRRLAIGRLPESLAGADGKHVWIGEPLAAPIQAGIIDPDRRLRGRRPARAYEAPGSA